MSEKMGVKKVIDSHEKKQDCLAHKKAEQTLYKYNATLQGANNELTTES